MKRHHGSTDSSAAVGHPSTRAFWPAPKNHTGVSGKSCEREPCPEQILQLTVPGVIQDSEERTVSPAGRLFPAAFLVPRWSLSARGSAGLRMQACAACSLFSKVIYPTLGLDIPFS